MHSKFSITEDGLAELTKELEERKTTTRERIANAIEVAREQGDLSENAAYKSAMEDKEFNEHRINELEAMIKDAEVYKADVKDNIIEMGEKVKLINIETKSEMVFQLVSSNEAEPEQKKISVDSPIGKAIIGKVFGSKVEISLPLGKQTFIVEKVSDK